MKFAPLVLLATAAAAEASDITIRTRTTFSGRPAIAQVAVLQVKGPRQRVVRTFGGPTAGDAGLPAVITQCDARRVVLVNDKKRLYAISSVWDGGPILAAEVGWTTPDTRPVAETITIDAVDTGDRRAFGALVARRVVTTTTTTERQEGRRTATRVQDGWYIDLPSERCEAERGAGYAFLMNGAASGRTEIKWKGTAKTGWPVIETVRSVDAAGTFVSTTSLVEFSEAPLDAALFDVPPGYRAALPIGNGAHDLDKPDTVLNRVRYAVESAASWVHYTWSRIGSTTHGETVARKR